eukprot:TRINITY_DN7076_c0_g4_i2.p1 TRINITY_DN7076_c0_g4~~TRINITY_DN7076_c0_g4_i2.p1  ORF type:complete len:138 (+),score=16.73 TRINITY_DN7076_c0_g4_i2:92-505(+)
MGRIHKRYLDATPIYVCCECLTHVVAYDSIMSKSFKGKHGRAYLFDGVVNVTLGAVEDRVLMTGHHQVADIYCTGCGTNLGWKYESAQDPSQRYKEGKYIIEKLLVKKLIQSAPCTWSVRNVPSAPSSDEWTSDPGF